MFSVYVFHLRFKEGERGEDEIAVEERSSMWSGCLLFWVILLEIVLRHRHFFGMKLGCRC